MNNEKVITIVMTKKRLLRRVCNEATAYRQYLVNFNAYVSENTFYRFRDVVTLYDEDICEYVEKDYVSKTQTDKVSGELCFFSVDTYLGYTIGEIKRYCDSHINDYNRR